MNEGNLRKSLNLLACFFMLVASPITYANSSVTEMKSKINGSWVSPKWSYGFRIDGEILDIGTPERLEKAKEELKGNS